MISWLAASLVRRSYRHTNEGNVEAVLATMSDDVEFVFPGQSSWAGAYRGKAEVERFIRRVVACGLKYEVHDVIVKGPPWDMTVVIVVTDEARDANGSVVYANRAVEYCKVRWGKIRHLEVYEDTQKSAAWDRVLVPAGA